MRRGGAREHGHSACFICKRMISNNGFGYVAHMRAHVRRGEAIESCGGMNGHYYNLYRGTKPPDAAMNAARVKLF